MNPYGVTQSPTYDPAELAAWTAEVEKARREYRGGGRAVEPKPKTLRTEDGTCNRPACDLKAFRRGLCGKHYRHQMEVGR